MVFLNAACAKPDDSHVGSMEESCPFCVPEPSRLLVSEGLVLALRDGYPVEKPGSPIKALGDDGSS
jgi:hypothetical protein